MAKTFYATVEDYQHCARQEATMKHLRHLMIFPPTRQLNFIAGEIFRPLHRTKHGNQYVATVTDRYSTVTSAIPTSKTSASHVGTSAFKRWIVPYGILSFLLADNGPRFVAKLFEKLCLDLNVKHLSTAAYNALTNDQVERYNRAVVA